MVSPDPPEKPEISGEDPMHVQEKEDPAAPDERAIRTVSPLHTDGVKRSGITLGTGYTNTEYSNGGPAHPDLTGVME